MADKDFIVKNGLVVGGDLTTTLVKFNDNEEDIYQIKKLSKKAISEGIESVINPQNTSF